MIQQLIAFKIYFSLHTEYSMEEEAKWDLRIHKVTACTLRQVQVLSNKIHIVGARKADYLLTQPQTTP